MAMISCPDCGFQTDDRARFCQKCGRELAGGGAAMAPAAGYAAPGYSQPGAYTYARYGGFWMRVLAAILDSILLGAVLVPLGFIFAVPMMTGDWEPRMRGPFLGVGFGPLWYGLKLVYHAAMESSSHQATIGKLICGLRVTDINGRRLSFPHAAGRYLAKLLSTMTLGIGYIMVAFTQRKQGLHDMVAGTLVMKR
jgi:uncharacterized RDD family membrane protein YckC